MGRASGSVRQICAQARGTDRGPGGAAFHEPEARGHHPGARSLRGLILALLAAGSPTNRLPKTIVQVVGLPVSVVEAIMGRNPDKLECDLVMRGGIASGIVYPRAVAKLAKTYNFRSIGGTSAGAIAAAATAAAQFGANNGDGRFETIYELPKKLAELKDGKSTLQRQFQPQPGTSRLFSLLMSGLEREGTFKKILRIVMTGLANYWCYSIAGAAVTLIPLLWSANARGLGGAPRAVLIITALILGLMTAIL